MFWNKNKTYYMIQWKETLSNYWRPYDWKHHEEFTPKDHYYDAHNRDGEGWAFFKSFKKAKKALHKKMGDGADVPWRIVCLNTDTVLYEVHPERKKELLYPAQENTHE